ncbi:sigma-70 family RNA polymerase sigma factor [Jatrophihabitans telluris]|uniref:Sigma-70 family RNA polymerase sigma factor n=1 Tax=Jatrophihabitans telluris TaxID=2038343 RepID=A0ABY4R1K8_9ACTN|nr:sigma-70 family RNA polymerase sigma factor [Jatrophihabitans telluris]UQX89011.1 sigma-70 family RNA polymerase sigma factor [Jatrophihabitans telluris]
MAGTVRVTMTDRPEDDAAALAERVTASDGVAELYRSHRLGMVRLALLLVDDLDTAEDVVQDAFASLHRRWNYLGSPDAAIGYLRVSVLNGSRSVLRRRRTVRLNPSPDEARAVAEGADAPTLLADEHREVLAAIRSLPRRQREVIVLRYWAAMTEPAVAEALGISLGAVKSNASRGRDAIAARIGGTR